MAGVLKKKITYILQLYIGAFLEQCFDDYCAPKALIIIDPNARSDMKYRITILLYNLPNTITPPSRNTETSTKRVRQERHDRRRTYTHTHQPPNSDSANDFNNRTENASHISHNDEARDESRRKLIYIRTPYMDANET